ncbi:glutamine cyclotransferase [Luteimonas sp. SDU82]|uniref:glutamine cyclotransferase n=1 Tax=Luteimonas sp. SDU82 TaxID=3422592 RepID=UPI003EB8D586
MNTYSTAARHAKARPAEIVREYGPFDGAEAVHGVSFDGRHVWAAIGPRLIAFDPASGDTVRAIERACDAGTAFDGQYLYQIAESRIDKLDPATGAVLHSIPAPAQGCDSGMAWADGHLWVGEYQARRIHQIDPATGEVLRSLDSDRFITGVSWVGDALWHGTWEDDESELRRIDPADGTVLERLRLPAGIGVSGLEADDGDLFYCGGGLSKKVRAVRRPRAAT